MKILNYGSLNIDRVYKVPHFVRPGETISSENYQCFPGGKGLNQSVAVARAGQRVYHAGNVGTDGDFLIDVLNKSHVHSGYVRKTDGITGHALIQVSGSGENCIILYGGSNYENDRVYVDQVLSHFDAGDILMLQNEISCLDYLLARGKQKGMRIMLNPSPMDEHLKEADLSGVTWLMLNETEGREMTGETEPERILNVLLQRWPEMEVILTLGKAGSVYAKVNTRIFQPAFPVQAVDTTAAGDTFTGYFAAAMLENLPKEQALAMAACAAAIAVTREGASVSIPARSEVEQRLASL